MLYLGRSDERQRVCRLERQLGLLQSHTGAGDVHRPLFRCGPGAGHRRIACCATGHPDLGRHASNGPARSLPGCCSESSSSSAASLTFRRWRSVRSSNTCNLQAVSFTRRRRGPASDRSPVRAERQRCCNFARSSFGRWPAQPANTPRARSRSFTRISRCSVVPAMSLKARINLRLTAMSAAA